MLPEVERIADRVAVIRDGELVTVSSIADLRKQARRRLEFEFTDPVDEAEFASLPGVIGAASSGRTVRVVIEGSVDPVVKVAAKYEVTNVVSHDADLEEIFFDLYRGRS